MPAVQALSQSLLDIFRRSGLANDGIEWFRKQNLGDPMAIALSVTKEEKVDSELIPLMTADGVKLDALHNKVTVRKTWTLCRTQMKDEETNKAGVDNNEDKMPPPLTG